MTSRIKVLVSYGGRIIEGEHGVDYEGGSHQVVFLQESFEYSDLVESISRNWSSDEMMFYRLPCMSNGVIHYYCMEVKDGDDIRTLVDSIVVVESTSYPQLYVKTRKYRVKGRRSVLTQEVELGGRRSFCGHSSSLLHEPVMQSGRHSVYASTSEPIGDPFILPGRHSVCAPSSQPFGNSTLQCDRRSVYVPNQVLSKAPFEPSLDASIYDEVGPSHEVMKSFRILSQSDVPLPESIDILIATNDCQSNPLEEEDSDGLLGQDDCDEEAMIEVSEAFQFTAGANYPVSADCIGSVGNTVAMVVGTEFDTTLEFQEKEDVINAVKQYSLNCSQEYEVAESSSHVWSVICKNTKYGYSRQLCAARLKKLGGGWGITRYKCPRTCVARVISIDHRQLDSNFICNCILEGVKKDLSKSVGRKHGRLNRRLSPEFGVIEMNHTNVYHISLQLCNRQILEVLYGGHSVITLMSGIAQLNSTKKKLSRLFWSFKPAIYSIEFTKPVIQIDGTFFYGKYKHSLLIATTINGDNSVILLAYALVESKNVDS
ncbi:uncharacterized protein LOC122019523 [Zingiber officinale]|uniref:uncharacterized protein LOC122019523 n=1 Tax=Zingiber officinale TaxID=94328 RepID=UPI001C4C822F|nr:uncharacterized protein LOC122019523 [Zingiber officinale]